MPGLAETFGLDPRPGAHTGEPGTVYVTFADQQRATLHIGHDLQMRRAVPPLWQQATHSRGCVQLVIGYRVMPPHTDATTFLAEVLDGHGVTATVPVRGPAPPLDDLEVTR